MIRVEVKYSDPEHNAYLLSSMRAYSKSMWLQEFLPEPVSEEALERSWQLAVLGNEMANFRHTHGYKSVSEGWHHLKRADLIQGKRIGCIDGRDSAPLLTDDVVDIHSVPAARIALRDRNTTDPALEAWEVQDRDLRFLVVASPDIDVKQQARADRRQQIFVVASAHAKNKQVQNGCAAWDSDIAPKLPKSNDPASERNADSLEPYTLKPILEDHNAHKHPDDTPLSRAGVSAILYTDDYDSVFRNGTKRFSAKEALLESRDQIRSYFGAFSSPGQFTEYFEGKDPINLDDHLRLVRKLLFYVTEIIDHPNTFTAFHKKAEDFIRNPEMGRFTALQEHYFKVSAARHIMLLNEIDFDQIPGHYYAEHREEAVGISERGNPPLQRHPIQTIAIVPANRSKTIHYGEIGLNVVSHAKNSGEPHIFFFGSDIPDLDLRSGQELEIAEKAVGRASSNNAVTFFPWITQEPFTTALKEGKLVVWPAAVGQDYQGIAGIFKHTHQAPRLFPRS